MRTLYSLFVFLVAVCSIAAPKSAFAWGELGHLTVCDLAYRNLTKPARDELNSLFRTNGRPGITVTGAANQDDRMYTSFNVGCLEEDERPRRHPKDYFINVSRDTTTIVSDSCRVNPSNSQSSACVFGAIDRDTRILRDRSKSNPERVMALMALGHWVGDIHQPLHVSFKDDAGGNEINVSVRGGCGTSDYRAGNLHAVWDNCLLQSGLFERVRRRADFKSTWGDRTITYRAVDTILANTTLDQRRAFIRIPMQQWAAESFEITRRPDVRYCIQVGGNCQYSETQLVFVGGQTPRRVLIDDAYRNAFKDVAEERVTKAGFRLAHLINQALDPQYVGP
jgi:hypothetical protein